MDTDIGARLADGEPAAIEAIYRAYGTRMAAMAWRILGDHDLAADAVQLAVLQAWRAAATFDPARDLGPWLLAITRHAAIDVYRHQRERQRSTPLDPVDLGRYEPALESAEDQAIRTWVADQVRDAIGRLPPTDQSVIRLAFLGDRTHREVATELGIPIGTVKSRLFRAQRRLAARLQHVRASDQPRAVGARDRLRHRPTAELATMTDKITSGGTSPTCSPHGTPASPRPSSRPSSPRSRSTGTASFPAS